MTPPKAAGGTSPRLKSLALTAGLSSWFWILSSSAGVFAPEYLLAFAAAALATTQLLASRVERALDAVAVVNTAVFLGLLFATLISLYGLLFRALRVDLLRTARRDSYWLPLPADIHDTVRQY